MTDQTCQADGVSSGYEMTIDLPALGRHGRKCEGDFLRPGAGPS